MVLLTHGLLVSTTIETVARDLAAGCGDGTELMRWMPHQRHHVCQDVFGCPLFGKHDL